jgi:hypothetical protein
MCGGEAILIEDAMGKEDERVINPDAVILEGTMVTASR